MRTRIYAKPEIGQVVDLTRPGMHTVLCSLVPAIAIAVRAHQDIVFHVVEVGPAVTVSRHEVGCVDALVGSAEGCRSCGGVEVTFHTDIWITAEVTITVMRSDKKGERRAVRETRVYSSRSIRDGAFVSPLTAEMLQLPYEDTEDAAEAEQGEDQKKQEA